MSKDVWAWFDRRLRERIEEATRPGPPPTRPIRQTWCVRAVTEGITVGSYASVTKRALKRIHRERAKGQLTVFDIRNMDISFGKEGL
jgi:hypothetical protein